MDRFLYRSLFIVAIALFLGNCASERTVRTERIYSSDDQKIQARFTSNFKNGENGAESDQRSEFENRTFGTGSKEFSKKTFATDKLVNTNEWAGKKDLATKTFGDASKGSSLRDKADIQTHGAREGALAYGSRDRQFGTNTADFSKDPMSLSERRVDVYENRQAANTPHIDAPVMDYREYARKTIEDTNAMLGRKIQY